MIRVLSGTVLSVESDVIILDVAGFGLEVFATGTLIAAAVAGEFLRCSAYLQISEAGAVVFGFSDDIERALFLEVTQVKTMGGKLSISLLRHLDAAAVVSAIMTEDFTRLAVPGIGAKRAERICFELRSKVEKKFADIVSGEMPASKGREALVSGVILGLVGLGFSQSEAIRAVEIARSAARDEDAKTILTEENLMKSALALLQKASDSR